MPTKNLVLRPNCLLTRSPLVFISGPRSVLSPKNLGQDLQEFLKAHGYQIEPLWLPFRAVEPRRQMLQAWVKNRGQKSFHFILPEETWPEFKVILEQSAHADSTFTLISQNPIAARKTAQGNPVYVFESAAKTPMTYLLHQFFCRVMGSKAVRYEQTLLSENKLIYDRFLDHCVELAENE